MALLTERKWNPLLIDSHATNLCLCRPDLLVSGVRLSATTRRLYAGHLSVQSGDNVARKTDLVNHLLRWNSRLTPSYVLGDISSRAGLGKWRNGEGDPYRYGQISYWLTVCSSVENGVEKLWLTSMPCPLRQIHASPEVSHLSDRYSVVPPWQSTQVGKLLWYSLTLGVTG